MIEDQTLDEPTKVEVNTILADLTRLIKLLESIGQPLDLCDLVTFTCPLGETCNAGECKCGENNTCGDGSVCQEGTCVAQ